MSEIWTIKRCMEWTEGYLGRRGEERPRLSAEWLLCAATGMKRIELYMNMDRPLAPEELAVMHRAVERRRAGEPLQYITGETSFRTLDVFCAPGVLIPRPETEMLVELVLEDLDQRVLGPRARTKAPVELPWNAEVQQAIEAEEARAAAKRAEEDGGDDEEARDAAPTAKDEEPTDTVAPSARVLEVGCGTGCISLSMAAERAGRITCVATDIEPRAVALAKRNRERAGIAPDAVDIRLGDLVEPVSPEETGTFDALVSNPPYIPSPVMATLPAEVASFEPALALDGGADGLDVFRRLLAVAPRMLRPGGLFACELFEESLDDAAELARAAGLCEVRVASDLTRRPRFVLAHTPEPAVG